MLQKALKSNFWPISGWFLLERPVPNQFFWKNITFIIKWISWADRSSTLKMAFLAVFSRVLEKCFQILQNHISFASFIVKNNNLLHVYYKKFMENFSIFTNFDFFSKIPREISNFLIDLNCPRYVWMWKSEKSPGK